MDLNTSVARLSLGMRPGCVAIAAWLAMPQATEEKKRKEAKDQEWRGERLICVCSA